MMKFLTWIADNVVQPAFGNLLSDIARFADWIVTNPVVAIGAPVGLWITLSALQRLENRRRS